MFKCKSFNQNPKKIPFWWMYIPVKASRKCIYIPLLGGSPEQAGSLIGSGSGFSVPRLELHNFAKAQLEFWPCTCILAETETSTA
jgi:hypothetical protein